MLFGRLSWILFGIACLLTLAVTTPRVWALRALYLDADMRAATREAMQTAADRNGWLLSDLSIRHIGDERLTLLYQPHLRGRDTAYCVALDLTSFADYPCAASF